MSALLTAKKSVPVFLAGSAVLALALTGCSGQANDAVGSAGGSTSSATGAAPVSKGAAQVKVTMANNNGKDECHADFLNAAAGPVTFEVSNTTATSLSEVELLSDQRILGERENVVPGLKAVSFTVTLSGGKYQLYCPGADTENTTFTVTGSSASATSSGVTGQLDQGAAGYGQYVDVQVASLTTAAAALKTAVDSGDLAASQKAYAEARPFYERIEPVAESFPGLDADLDLRVADVVPGTPWTGFHPLEKDLFTTKAITPATKTLAAGIVTNVAKLKSLTAGLKYKPEELANGASGLLEEVQSSKITGEEEAYSHLDLVDFAANVEGSQQAFEYLKPALTTIDPQLTAQISKQFDVVNQNLDTYKDASALGGYKPYTAALKAADAAKLTQVIQSLQQPLAQIAAKVATA